MKRLILIFPLVLVGCGSIESEYLNTLPINIGEELSIYCERCSEQLNEALKMWNNSQNQNIFHLTQNSVVSIDIVLTDYLPNGHKGYTTNYGDYCVIEIYKYSQTSLLFAHELGHCLGLRHSSDPNSIMSINPPENPTFPKILG